MQWDRHRKADKNFVPMFIREWELYREMLASQVLQSSFGPQGEVPGQVKFGRNLSKDQVEAMSDDQLGQLYALRTEVFNPEEGGKK
ncbi:hypothetical protein HDU96_008633 [Phlyctochytrium bullatum]|nr:hypothetical protein HDU96_008633 [Phlyctochytrium bullatum]